MKRIVVELVMLFIIGGLLWATFAYITRAPAKPTLISIETEMNLGHKYHDLVLSMNEFKEVNCLYVDSVLSYTASRLESSNEKARYSYKISLVKNDMINAFALPGGYIIVTTGLVDFCETTEEFLSVICHEIGHIENRHVISRAIKTFGLELITSNDPFVMGEIASTILSTSYNRRQEMAADKFAGELMLKNSMDPRVLAKLLRRLSYEKGMPGEELEFLSSHPNIDSRMREILAIELPENFEPVESWINWNSFRTHANKQRASNVLP